MGGGGAKGGQSADVAGEAADNQALASLASQSTQQSGQLFNLAFPGMQTAESHEQDLASGDPSAIARAIAPAAQQVTAATNSAKSNIMNNAPSGGEKNLALEQADVNQGSQVGNLASQGYNNSFNSLAQLGGSGVGLSENATSGATSAYGSANQGYNASYNEGIEQKGSTLGALGGLAGDATGLGIAKMYS